MKLLLVLVLVTLFVGLAVVSVAEKNWPKALYWTSSALITASVHLMK